MPDNKTQLNIKIDPKVHWLANLCARYQGSSLAEFVERAICDALSPERVQSHPDEPRAGHVIAAPLPSPQLWQEALWNEDEATRLFNIGLIAQELLDGSEDYDLFTESQRKVWSRIAAAVASEGKKLTLNTFRQHYAVLKGIK